MIISDLEFCQPQEILHTGEELYQQAQTVIQCSNNIRSSSHWSSPEWSGESARAAQFRIRASNNHVNILGLTLYAAGKIIYTCGFSLQAPTATVQGTLKLLQRMTVTISPQGIVTPQNISGAVLGPLCAAFSAVLTASLASAQSIVSLASSSLSDLQHEVDLHPNSPNSPNSLHSSQEISKRSAITLPSHIPLEKIPHGDGVAFIAGDTARAEEIITVVSGMGSSEAGRAEINAVWAREQVALATREGRNIAVVAWHGYTAPSGLPTNGIKTDAAQRGAQLLEDFQHSMRVKNPTAVLHLVGHSYGSVLIGQRQPKQRKSADEVTLWGSPGTGASHADALAPYVRNEMAAGDIIDLVDGIVHRGSPTNPNFGARGAHPSSGWAGWWNDVMDYRILSLEGTDPHSYYRWDPSVTERMRQ